MDALLAISNNQISGEINENMIIATLTIDSSLYRKGRTYTEIFSVPNGVTLFRFISGYVHGEIFVCYCKF